MDHTDTDFRKVVESIKAHAKHMNTPVEALSNNELLFLMLYEINENIKTNNAILMDLRDK